MVVNQVGNVYRSVRSEMFVMLFHGRNFVVEVVMFQRRCCLRLDEASRPVLDSLVFARRHRHKSVESSHVVDTCWGQRLTECSRCSLRFTLGSVGGTGAWVGQRVPVVRLVAGVQRVRSVHDRRLVFFHLRSWWMCFHETIAVHNRRMILAHCSVSRGWNTFAATGIFGGGALNGSHRLTDRLAPGLTDRSIVPSLSLILARCRRQFLGASLIGWMHLQWLRNVMGLLVVEVAVRCSHRPCRSWLSVGSVL